MKDYKIKLIAVILGILILQSCATQMEYLFAKQKESKISSKTLSKCNLPPDFKEPKSDKATYRFLKMGDATTDDLKKHVAIENNCSVNDIVVLKMSEQKGNGMYELCVNGKLMKYKRIGSVFSKN